MLAKLLPVPHLGSGLLGEDVCLLGEDGGLLCEDVGLRSEDVVLLGDDLLGEGEHVGLHPQHPQEGPHTSQLSSPVENSRFKSKFELFCRPGRASYKLDGVGPVDNRPSTGNIHPKKKKKNVTCDT